MTKDGQLNLTSRYDLDLQSGAISRPNLVVLLRQRLPDIEGSKHRG
jgi:hypothetical protein